MSNIKHKEQRVGVFVDVQNMYYSAKNLYSSKVDFNRVLTEAVMGRRLIRAFAYVIKAAVGAEREFFEALSKIGFEVREKDLQIFYTGEKKGDWDVGLCMDVVRMLPKLDVMVLVSGDGDYVDLLEYARSQGVKTEIIAFGQTASSRLTEVADEVLDMSKNSPKYLIRTSRIPSFAVPGLKRSDTSVSNTGSDSISGSNSESKEPQDVPQEKISDK